MEKRTAQGKEKYQPSYETTILTEVSRPGAGVHLLGPSARSRMTACSWFRFLGNCPPWVNAALESAYKIVADSWVRSCVHMIRPGGQEGVSEISSSSVLPFVLSRIR